MSVKVMAQRINLPNVGERFCLRTARADSVSQKEPVEYVCTRIGKYLSVGDNKLEIQLPSDI